MVSFILNNKLIETNKPVGLTLLDFIRYESGLKGTKIGCREGDCGACTVIEGQLNGQTVKYKTIVSCLTPLANVHGKHIVTVEGLNKEQLSPVQQALVDHNGTQCGFCTPGFVISLTAFLLTENGNDIESAIAAIDGNICRCTGYKSIERAATKLVGIKKKMPTSGSVSWLVNNDFIPEYFSSIGSRLKEINNTSCDLTASKTVIGGGTDLYVQKPDELVNGDHTFILNDQLAKKIIVNDNICSIKGYANTTDLMESAILQNHFPHLKKHFKLISSTTIRNMGTIAGNIVNASPIGDLSIFFLALDADIILSNNDNKKRTVKLKELFEDYKKLNLRQNELIEKIEFQLPGKSTYFNFEKVSKRQYLDIASVNSAIKLSTENGKIKKVSLSAGGVSPIPLFLKRVSKFLEEKEIGVETVIKANEIAQQEISPISDIRGSAEYKRLLLRQLIFAHFIEIFPEKISLTDLTHQAKA